ncbi:hypothetical protein [Burkholderia gladioli]|uniref:hypothetical protein n=1 Tax=Burkholderia gladioli TaxID=28095 RepID=UPI000FD8D8F2|nr:hypothetical protein [Burkholderia gladioli]MDC6133930.1 hypothetical protein [Burkholderia gladioli]
MSIIGSLKKAWHDVEKTIKDAALLPNHLINATKPQKEVSLNVIIENRWGSSIGNVSLSHTYAGEIFDRATFPEIKEGEELGAFDARFRIHGKSVGHDYWIVKFEVDDKIWMCKVNFYCDLYSEDYEDGGHVICRIEKENGSPEMRIIPPKTSDASVSLQGYPFPESNARPVYAIAHKCNDKYDVALSIHSGCNAIECDLKYDSEGETMYVSHDHASGFSLEAWLDDTKEVMNSYPNEFDLIIFDCKFVSDIGGEKSSKILVKTREIIRKKLTSHGWPINFVFSISEYKNRSAFSEISKNLDGNEGIAIDESSEPEKVESFFKEINCKNVWYGNGIFVAGLKAVSESIRRGSALRDKNGIIKKVYVWTLEKEESIKEYYIDNKVDGVFINPVGMFKGVGNELHVIYGEKSLRLSRRGDDPFAVHK